MGSGGNTTSQAQQTYQSYTPNPLTAGFANQVFGAAQGLPGPGAVPLQGVADLNPGQLQAMGSLYGAGLGTGANLIPGGQNMLGWGTGIIGGAANPITGSDVANFYNPMAGNITAQMQNIFGQQQAQTRANAITSAGGVGAERSAIAPALLANQQGLAAGQTYAGLYQQALQAAQQQKQQQLASGMGLAGFGIPTLQAGFGGLNTALQTAGIGQTQQQNILNAIYGQQQGQYQNPYQNLAAQLAALQGVGGVMGGTQVGIGNQQTTYPQPSMLTQIAGLGIAGAGALGGLGGFGSGMGALGWKPLQARGGRIERQSGGAVLGEPYLNAIKRFEGYSERPAWDYKQWTSGYGTRAAGPRDIQPKEVLEQRFQHEVGNAAESVDAAYPNLPEGPRAALTSLTYNAGPGWMNNPRLNNAVKSGDWDTASALMQQYNMAGGQRLPGLVARRGEEAGWMRGSEPYQAPESTEHEVAGLPQQTQDVAAASYVPPVAQAGENPSVSPQPSQGGGSGGAGLNMALQGLKMAQGSYPQVQPIQFPSFRTPGVMGAQEGGGIEGDDDREPPGGPNPDFGYEGVGRPPGAENVSLTRPDTGQGGNPPYGLPGGVGGLPPIPRPPAGGAAASPWMALMQAGLGMAAAAGQRDARGLPMSPLSAIGAGGMQGVKMLETQREQARRDYDEQMKAYSAAMQQMPYQQPTAYQAGELASRRKQLELEGAKPFKIGEDPETGLDIYGIRDPKGNITIIDPKTGRPQQQGADAAPVVPAKQQPTEPAPLGVEELRSNLEPTKQPGPHMLKGPFATAEAQNIKAIDAQMNKGRDALDVQRDQLTRLKMDYAIIMKDSDKDGFFTKMLSQPGVSDPEARVDAMRKANAVATAAGKAPIFDPAKVAAIEEAIKIQKTMGMSFAATISPRDSMQMQLASISAQPGFTQSPQGMQRLIGLYDGIVNHSEARHDFWGRWKQTNPRSSTGWEEDFRHKNPSDAYTVRALVENSPYTTAVSKLSDAVKHLKEHKDDQAYIDKFNKVYNNTASFFLTGKLDPYAILR